MVRSPTSCVAASRYPKRFEGKFPIVADLKRE